MQIPTPAQISAAIDADEMTDLLFQAVKIDSLTGNEGAVSRFLADELRSCTDTVHLIDVVPGRPLVYGYLRGRGEAEPVYLMAHTDTVLKSDDFPPQVVGDRLRGIGAADDKGGIAAAITALRAMKSFGVRPAGDVVILLVPDEESGQPQLGRSIGIHRAIQMIKEGHLQAPGFGIYLEPTSNQVAIAQMGFLIGEVELKGRASYWAKPEDGIDAVRAVTRISAALYSINDRLAEENQRGFFAPPVLQVTGIQGGGKVAVPHQAALSFIRNVLPTERMDAAEQEIRAAIDAATAGTGVEIDVEFPAARDHRSGGYQFLLDLDLPRIRDLSNSAHSINPNLGNIVATTYWSEGGIFYAQLGVPCVYFGPGSIDVCHIEDEYVDLTEVHACAASLTHYLILPSGSSA